MMPIFRAEVVDDAVEFTAIDVPVASVPLVSALAAPDLLASLRSLVGWLERHRDAGGETPPEEMLNAARAAIAKATGGGR